MMHLQNENQAEIRRVLNRLSSGLHVFCVCSVMPWVSHRSVQYVPPSLDSRTIARVRSSVNLLGLINLPLNGPSFLGRSAWMGLSPRVCKASMR